MRHFYAGLMACTLLGACAHTQLPAVAAMPAAIESAPKAAAIADAEPDVTKQVSAFLGSAGQGMFGTEKLTDNARTAMTVDQMRETSRMLAPCGTAPALELLARTTKGEDRQYQYRAPCGGNALLVDIDFNKGAKINKLEVRPE